MRERRVLDKRPAPDPSEIALAFLAEHHTACERYGQSIPALRWWREDYYAYRDGFYRRVPTPEVKAEIVHYLRQTGIRVTTHLVAAVLLCLNGLVMIRSEVEPGAWLDDLNLPPALVVRNGRIVLGDHDDKGRPKRLPHSASLFSLTALSYDYNPEADCPRWERFMNEIMSGDVEYVTLIQQWCGYLFRHDLREHRFLMMVGDGSNGKGVFCEVVESLVGSANVSHVPLGMFARPFSLHGTLGKTVNITAESCHTVEDTAETVLKSFVAGDAMTFERKFRDPINAIPTAKIMIATNALPRFNDKTFGLWRRVLLVPFQQTFTGSRQNKRLAAELKEELPGILNWALKGLESLSANEGFDIPQEHDLLIEEYRRDADPCRAFLLEHYVTTPNGEYVPCDTMYQNYRRWCKNNEARAIDGRQFGQQVRRIFPNASIGRPGKGNSRRRVYRGIASKASNVTPI